jgi:hypothetical protein
LPLTGGNLSGNLRIAPVSSSWAEGLSFTMPTTSTWGGIRWRRERGNNDGNWYIGYTALDSSDDLVFGANNGGSQADNILRLTKAGVVTNNGNQILHAGNSQNYRARSLNSVRTTNSNFNDLSTALDTFTAGTNYIPSGGSYNQPADGDHHYLAWGGIEGAAVWGAQIDVNFYDDRVWFRRQSGANWQAWRQFIHDGNYGNYALPLSGGALSGNITFPNDSANGIFNAAGNAGYRPDDAYGNTYMFNQAGAGGWYGDFSGYYFRSTGSSNWMTISGSAVNSSVALQQSGNQVLHAGNYTSYAVPLTNGTATNITLGARVNSSSYGGNTSSMSGHSFPVEVRANGAKPTLTWHYESVATRHIALDADGALNLYNPGEAGGAVFKVGGNIALHAGNYTSYAMQGAGYSTNQNLGTGNQVTFDSVITNNNGNGTNIRLGDDAWLGDCNIANAFRIRGVQDAAAGFIVFGSDTTQLGRTGTGALTWGGNQVIHQGNPQATTEWYHSGRDFPSGTLITTDINYAVTYGDPFVLEIRGNSYGNIIPLDLQYQGYIYADTIINHGGLSNGLMIQGLVAINNGGNLCFWFPSQGYWNGYNVKVYAAYATRAVNRVTSITGTGKPTTAKEVALTAQIRQSLHSSNFGSYALPLSGGTVTGNTTIGRDLYISGQAGGSLGNRLIVGNTTTSYTLEDTNIRPVIQIHGAYPVLSLNHTVANANHGPTIQFTCNGTGNQFVIGTGGTGAQLDMGYSANGNWNPHNGIAGYQGTTFFRAMTNGYIGLGAVGNWGAIGGGDPGYNLHFKGANNGTGGFAAVFENTANAVTGGGFLFQNNFGNHSYGVVAEFRVNGVSDRPSILFSSDQTATRWSVGFGQADDQFRISQNLGHRNQSWGTERFRIDTGGTPHFNGNVALHAGNYSSYALPLGGGTVSGTANFTNGGGYSAFMHGNGNTGSVSGIGMQVYSTGANGAVMSFHRGGYYAVNMGLDSDNVMRIGGWSAGANRWQLDMSGNMTVAGNVTAYSDERLKKDWGVLPADYIERLAKIKSGTYTRIDSEERQAGVSAQDFQKLLPETVSTDNDGMLSVNYGGAALASAVELAKRVVEQEKRIAHLESLINKLIGD